MQRDRRHTLQELPQETADFAAMTNVSRAEPGESTTTLTNLLAWAGYQAMAVDGPFESAA